MIYPIKVNSEDSANIFLLESITEWIASYLSKGSFNYSPNSLVNFGTKSSLDEIKKNDIHSWEMIYNYGPYIIQKFANSTGSTDTFFYNLTNFIVDNRDNEINYDQF